MQHLLNSSEGVDQNKLQNLPRQVQVHVFVSPYIAFINLDLKTTTLKVFTLYYNKPSVIGAL